MRYALQRDKACERKHTGTRWQCFRKKTTGKHCLVFTVSESVTLNAELISQQQMLADNVCGSITALQIFSGFPLRFSDNHIINCQMYGNDIQEKKIAVDNLKTCKATCFYQQHVHVSESNLIKML